MTSGFSPLDAETAGSIFNTAHGRTLISTWVFPTPQGEKPKVRYLGEASLAPGSEASVDLSGLAASSGFVPDSELV